jgi:uncharacterized cupin superfamily protein
LKQNPIPALSIPLPAQKTIYPQPFAALVEGRAKRKLGEHFGLSNFGINLTQLAPSAISALLHHHSKQDEFIYILEGSPTLVLGNDEHVLKPGDCMGFKAGTGVAHQLINRTNKLVTYLEAGDRTVGDEVEYPQDDLKATQLANGVWSLTHKDSSPY